jgi:DNA (cytosine-5)-methyltransferase 1
MYLQRDIFAQTDEYPEGQGQQLLGELSALVNEFQTRYPRIPLLLAICAPCQPFTQMTRIEMTDERSLGRLRDRGLLGQTFKYVEELTPTLILSENVAGIQKESYGGVWQDFEGKLRQNGYVVGSNIVDCSRFGIPQIRKRSIMLAINKVDCLPEVVVDADAEGNRLTVPDRDPESRVVTVQETIGRFPPIKAGEKHGEIDNHETSALSAINLQRIRLVQPGGDNFVFNDSNLALPCHQRLREKPKKEGKGDHKRAFSDIYTRMHPDKPSPTITTKCTSISNGRFGHYDMSQDRAISVREAAALQTFPDDYVFYGDSFMATAKMVGNAVPPKLSQFFAEHLLKGLRPDARPYYFPDDTPAQRELPLQIAAE